MSDWLDIHAHADDQLSDEEKARVNSRLQGCDKSRAELAAIHAVKGALEARRDTVTCDETWQRCQRRLDELDKTARIESFVGRYAWALCGLFLALILGVGMLNRTSGSFGADDVPRIAAGLTPFLSSPSSQDANTKQRFVRQKAGNAPIRAGGAGVELVRGDRKSTRLNSSH